MSPYAQRKRIPAAVPFIFIDVVACLYLKADNSFGDSIIILEFFIQRITIIDGVLAAGLVAGS